MKTYNVNCRMATINDDITLISKYIHLTDEYIYPAICSNPCDEEWQKVINDCYFAKDNVFSMENIVVAELEGKIVGILCAIKCGQEIRFIEDVSKKSLLYDNLSIVNKGYFIPLIEESKVLDGYNITNVCVDKELRGMGIGSKLMDYAIKRFENSFFYLDVIQNNETAIKLYQNKGFNVTKEYYGFSGTEKLLPCYQMKKD